MEELQRTQFDAIVVGTGPGGATVAKELSAKKKKVLMLEWGSSAPLKGTTLQAALMAGIPGRSALITYGGLAMVRGIVMGGSSVLYYASAFDPPHDMLKSYGIDIRKEVEQTKKELPVAPMKDELVGPMASRIMDTARDLGYDWNKFPKFLYQDRCKTDCDKCSLGCPYEAKWSARMYVDEALNNGAQLIDHARVKRVITEGNTATGVEFSRWGKSFKAFAPVVIVAAGGIGSPVILRNSGLDGAGYDFFYDPLIAVMGTVKDIKGGREFPMAAGMNFPEEGYVMTDMTIPRLLYQGFTAEVFRFDRLFSHSRTLQIMVKAKDSLGGRLTNSGGVRKRLAKDDRGKLLRGAERAREILKHAGAKHIYKSWYIAAHPGGTVRVGDMLDANLKTEYDNLYVCDCSVIPEAWGLPPTLTLVGLGKRLANHLTAGGAKKTGKKKGAV